MSLSNRWAGHTRVGTAAQLAGVTLAPGQVAYETDTRLTKRGPGAFSALSYEPALLYRTVTQVTFPANDATERTVMSCTVPAGALANNGDFLSLFFEVKYLLNAASNNWFNVNVRLGGSTIMHSQCPITQSATRRKVNFTGVITRLSATTAQGTVSALHASTSATTVGQGGLGISSLSPNILSTPDTPPTCAWGSSQTFEIALKSTADAAIDGVFWSGSISLNK